MQHPLRDQLFKVIIGFLFIIVLSLLYNQLSLRTHETHDVLLHEAYELRLTTHLITAEVSLSKDPSLDLTESIERFNQNVNDLRNYDEAVDRGLGEILLVPEDIHQIYNTDLDTIMDTWLDFIMIWGRLSALSPTDADYDAVRQEAIDILDVLKTKVDAFNANLEEFDTTQSRNQSSGQFIYLGLGLIMLAWGSYIIIFRVIKPLNHLDTAVQQMGSGELLKPIKLAVDDELGRLSGSFDSMRVEIHSAQKLLEERVEERTGILTEAFEFSQEIVSQPNFTNLVNSVTLRAKNLIQAKSAGLYILNRDMNRLDLVSHSGDSFLDDEQGRYLKRILLEGIVNTMNSEAETAGVNKVFLLPDNYLSIPLHGDGSIFGVLFVTRSRTEPFINIENHTLKLLANSTAIAISNIRLAEDSRRQAEMNATLNERQRLTSDLHDEASQTLNLLNLKVDELEEALLSGREEERAAIELMQFKYLVERAQTQMRMAFAGMSSPSLPKGSELSRELTDHVEDFSNASGIHVELQIDDLSALTIPALVQKQAMYIYREALTNIRRYAEAKHVTVRLGYENFGLAIMIVDDGRGFDRNLSRTDHHLGLAVMQARVERLGGSFSIETAPGEGTRVIANIPLLARNGALLTDEERY